MSESQNKSCYFKMDRPVYQLHEINQEASKYAQSADNRPFEDVTGKKRKRSTRNALTNVFPILDWGTNYHWKEDFMNDAIAGFTVAVMNIPQGMAYALLANVPPVVGIYMAFYPVLVYALLGTSRHISMGSFAVVCLMVGQVVASVSLSYSDSEEVQYSNLEIATAVTFAVGIFQMMMYICKLGVICSLLSDTLISAFTSAAAIHVFTSQLKDIFGFKLNKYNGLFQVIRTYIDLFNKLDTINWMATAISLITGTILVINNEFFKPWLGTKCIVPMPIELILVLSGTLVSMHTGIAETYDLNVVGAISIGLPSPKSPPFSLLPDVALESFIIATVAYIVSISMALVFAQKLKYEIRPNQELLAQSAGNLVGSFFSCAPFSASLSRSVVQQSVGGKTQLASLVSCFLLLIVLLWIAPFFSPLPCCILSTLIVVALKSVLLQVKDFPRIWHLSVLDGMVWIITYSSVIILDIDVGLLIGLSVSVVSLLIQGMKPYTCLLGRIPTTDIYVDKAKYKQVIDSSGIRIVHYSGGINFANRGNFKNEIYNLLNIWPRQHKSKGTFPHFSAKVYTVTPADKVKCIIFDLSGIHYIDPSGAIALRQLAEEFCEIGIHLYAAAPSEPVYQNFRINGLMESNLFMFFPTIHDAVLFAEHILSQSIDTATI